MKVKDILKRKGNDVYTADPEDSVFDAIAKMADLDIGVLVVMKNDRLVGIISERDYRNKVILKGRASKTTTVKEIMVDQVFCVEPDEKVSRCMKIMSEKKIRHLPVLDGKKVAGMISIGDVVKSIIDNQKGEINSLKNYIATGGSYPV